MNKKSFLKNLIPKYPVSQAYLEKAKESERRIAEKWKPSITK